MSVFKCDIKYKKIKGDSLTSTLNKLKAHKFIIGDRIPKYRLADFLAARKELNEEASKLLNQQVNLFTYALTPEGMKITPMVNVFKLLDNLTPFKAPIVPKSFERDIKFFRGDRSLYSQEQTEDKELKVQSTEIDSIIEDINNIPEEETIKIKPGVEELFNENPELANAVYEALGFRTPSITVLPNGNLRIVAFRTEKVGYTSKGEYQRGKGLYLSLDKPYPGEDVYTVEIEVSPKNLLDRKLGFGEISEDYFINEKNKRVDKQLDTLHEFKQSLGIKAEIGSIDDALMNELVLFDKDLINQAITSKQQYNPQQKQQAQQLYSQYLSQNPNGSVEGFKNWVTDNQPNVQEQQSTFFQIKNIFRSVDEIETKLKHVNKTINSIGSEKNINEILKKAGLDAELRKQFISLVNDNPSLKSLKISEVLYSYLREFVKESDRQYYKAIDEPLSTELENILIDYFDRFKISRQEIDNLKERFGVDSVGVFDVLAKTIYYAKNRNLLTLPEEYGHVFVELLGSISNKKADNPLFTYLFNNIDKWDGYQRVFRDYKDRYVTKEGNIDIYKIKKEAIGQAIGIALVRNYKVQKGETGFWSKVQEVIDYILDLIKGIDYVSLNTTVDSIAKDIINKNYDKLDRLKKDTSNYNLLSYSETIKNQNKIDGGKALKFMQWFSEKGMLITGSLAYRLQGTTYRPEIDALHDIDNIVPSDIHKVSLNKKDYLTPEQLESSRLYHKYIIEGNYAEAKKYKLQGNIRLNIDEIVDSIEVLQEFKKQFPETEFLYSFYNEKANAFYITINAIWSKNQELKDRFKSFKGSFNSRLENFTKEELEQIYLFDFFLRPELSEEYVKIEDSEFGLSLAHFNYSFYEKLNMMGRPKDAFDYQMWDYYEDSSILPPDFNDRLVYFQIDKSKQKQQFQQSLNKPNTNPVLQGNQQEQVKKFKELQERLNNKEFLEGAKNAFESTSELQQFGTQEQYNDYIARVSLGIVKNPTSGEYNYESQVKDIVYHGTNLNFDKFDKTKIGGNTAVKGEKPSFSFSNNKQQAEAYSSEITVGQNTNELAKAWFEENQHVFKNGDINTGIIDINNVFDHYKKELGDSKEMISLTGEIDPVTDKYKLVPVNDKNLKELSEIKTKEWQQEYNTLLTAGARVMSVILNIKNSKIVDFKGEKKSVKFKEEQLSTKGDAFIAKNIDDWGKGDVIQVFEPEQIHILSSKADIQGFKEFVQEEKDDLKPFIDESNKIEDESINERLKKYEESIKIPNNVKSKVLEKIEKETEKVKEKLLSLGLKQEGNKFELITNSYATFRMKLKELENVNAIISTNKTSDFYQIIARLKNTDSTMELKKQGELPFTPIEVKQVIQEQQFLNDVADNVFEGLSEEEKQILKKKIENGDYNLNCRI